MTISYIFSIFVIVLLTSSCKTGPAPCIHDDMVDIQMKWGDYEPDNRTFDGYKIFSTGLVQKYKRNTEGLETGNDIGYLNNDDLCKVISFYYWVMKKVQTCHEPGNNLKYLTFINDNSKTYWNVVWNEDFSTGSNKNLKVVYDSLNNIIQRID